MEKVSGIGGFFFRSKDPNTLAKWYEKNLGIGLMDETTDSKVWRQHEGPTVFAPFGFTTDYYPSEQHCMLNFRVNDMKAMLRQLEENGVKIDEKRQEDAIGKFAWVYDLEGNKIELWEPSDEYK